MLTNLTKHQNRCLFISVACYGKRKKKEEEKKKIGINMDGRYIK